MKRRIKLYFGNLRAKANILWRILRKKSRGTDVILHLREDEKEFLNEWRLREIIGKYSDHIGLPVEMLTKEYDDEGKECGEKWEKINKSDALWTRSKNDVSDEEYKAFYKHLSHDFSGACDLGT